jgi:membrane associated rhomboid family serine protease
MFFCYLKEWILTMIIVPTEKQLNWRNAPLMLCVLVGLNVMAFFLYQSGDNSKLLDALFVYDERAYFDLEWPLYQNYLEENKRPSELQELRGQLEAGERQAVIVKLLMDEGFFTHLQRFGRSYFSEDFYDEWLPERHRIDQRVASLSYLALGLRAKDRRPITFISHQFLHGDIMHLLGNLFFLIVCGFAVEAAIGHWRFLIFYLVSGFAAGFAQVASDWQSTQPLVGASGAISGVMAMYLAIFRWKKIEFFYWFFFFVGYFRAPALLILPFYIGNELHSYYNDVDSNVAFMAHAGGFAAGSLLILGAWLFNRTIFNREYIEGDQTIDAAQQYLADIYEAIERFRFTRALELVEAAIPLKAMSNAKHQFELAKIRYNLLRIGRGEAYLVATQQLLSLAELEVAEVRQLEKIWRDNPEVQGRLTEVQAIKLGAHFAMLDNPSSAEQIFELISARAARHPMLAVFAKKLANSYERLSNLHKKSYYDKLAKQLAEGAERGLL